MKKEERPRFLMNQSKITPNLIRFRGRMGLWKEFEEGNENEGHPQNPLTSISSSSKNKILSERNTNDSSSNTHLEKSPKENIEMINSQETHLKFSENHSFSDSSVPYDPVNNYTSPRPAFLRYNPDRRKEILLRMQDEEVSEVKSIEEDSLSVSSNMEIQEDEEERSDVEVDDFKVREAKESRSWCSRKVLKLLFLIGVFLFSHYHLFSMSSSPSSPFQEKLTSNGNLLHWHLLKTHMGLSNECLDIGEGMCDLFFPVDSLPKNDLPMPDEANEVLGSDELAESVEDLMYEDTSQSVEELVIEKEREEEPMRSHKSLELEWNNQREGSAKEENLEIETDENSKEFVIEEEGEEPIGSHVSIEHEWNRQREESAKEVILVNAEDSHTCKEAFVETNSTMEVEGIDAYQTSLRWKQVLDFASKDFQLLFLSLSLLTVMFGILSNMSKFCAKSQKKASRISAKDSNLHPLASNHLSSEEREESLVSCSQSAGENMICPLVSTMNEMGVEGKDSNVNNNHLPNSSYLRDETKGFFATRPPTVEFLGEFSIADGRASKAASTQTSKGKRHNELKDSIFFDEPRLSQSERSRTVKVKSPPPSNKVHSSYDEREPASHEKLVKEADTAENKSERKKAVQITPLRRSNRLRKRVTSPTQQR